MSAAVLLVGEVLIDFLGEGGASLQEAACFRPHPGGAPANAAVAAARAGASVAFAGCVGRDAFGRSLRRTLIAAGVDCGALAEHPDLFTTLAFVMPKVRGDLGFQFMRGADAALMEAHLPATLLDGLRVLGCGGVSLSADPARGTTLSAMRRARAGGAVTAFDVNWRPALWASPEAAAAAFRVALPHADIVKCNERELELLTGTAGAPEERARGLLADPGPRAVAVTLGERGALWVTAGRVDRHPGYTVPAVDAVGAGDCFFGNLLAWWARRQAGHGGPQALAGPEGIALLRRCNAAAALSTTRAGAMGSMPPAARVDAMLSAAD